MKTLPCFVLLLFALTVSVEARTWTAKTGQTLDGEYIKLEDENVLIKLTNGKKTQIKLDLLSDEDQQFVQEAENPFEIVDPAEEAAALTGVWRHSTYDVFARSWDIYLWFINKDGTFKIALVTSENYFYEGNYSVSGGKITLTNVVFTNDDYVGNKPDSKVEYVIDRDSEGKEQLEISINPDGFVPSGSWNRVDQTESTVGGASAAVYLTP